MATFILDARSVQDHFPGIGRYTFRLACALADFFPDYRFRLLYDARVRNTRFDVASLFARANVERVDARAKFFSVAEQRLALDARISTDANAYHSPYYALPFLLRVPAIVTLADVTPLVLHSEMPNPFKRLVYLVFNQIAARRAQAVITFSNASRADLERVLQIQRAKISVVPLAADETFAPAPPTEIERVRNALGLPEKYVLYIGSNKPHKNLPRLIEAWARVESDTALVIAGAWDARYPQAERIAARLNLGERVLFRRAIAEADLPAVISGAQWFVFPSVHEGFGLPPLEAMACGAPVICSNASSLPEVVGDAALLFDPIRIQDIARVLSDALNDARVREHLRARGLERARQFSWQRVARETMRVYEQVARIRKHA
jgi:alpha-1,3-rhamnosyl/mannosyltransferase